MFGRRLADFFTGRDPRGGNVATTINPQVQQAAWDAMQDGCNGPCTGAVVALEPSTGKILAMVSAPSYDPNLLASHDVNEQSDAWQQLRDDPGNPAAQPGDLGDLPAGIDVQGDHHGRRAADRGHAGHPAAVRGAEFRCRTAPQRWRTSAARRAAADRRPRCGTRSRSRATPRSSSSASTPVPTRCKSTAQAFGLDASPAPIPLQVAESTVGPISDGAALGMSSIGQKDVALTPLQNALVAATIANNGVAMQPYLVDSLKGPDLANIATTTPREQRPCGVRAGRRLHLRT